MNTDELKGKTTGLAGGVRRPPDGGVMRGLP